MSISLRKVILGLTLVAAICFPFMLILHDARQVQLHVRELEACGAQVWFAPNEGWTHWLPRISLVSVVEYEGTPSDLAPLADLEIPHLAYVHARLPSELVDLLTRVEGLQKLNLSDTDVDDAALERLATVETLTYLNVMGSKVTAAGVLRFQRRRPDCILSVAPDNTFMLWLNRLFDT